MKHLFVALSLIVTCTASSKIFAEEYKAQCVVRFQVADKELLTSERFMSALMMVATDAGYKVAFNNQYASHVDFTVEFIGIPGTRGNVGISRYLVNKTIGEETVYSRYANTRDVIRVAQVLLTPDCK